MFIYSNEKSNHRFQVYSNDRKRIVLLQNQYLNGPDSVSTLHRRTLHPQQPYHTTHNSLYFQLETQSRFNAYIRGSVEVFEVSSLSPITVKKSHTCNIASSASKSLTSKLSAVSSLSWTSDGFALAVGWFYGGYSVWSVFGCMLSSTISEDTYVHSRYFKTLIK